MNYSVALPSESILNKAFQDSGRPGVVKWDVVRVQNGDLIKLIFESANPEGRHGVWLKTDHGLDVNGLHVPSAELFILWAITHRKINTNSKNKRKILAYEAYNTHFLCTKYSMARLFLTDGFVAIERGRILKFVADKKIILSCRLSYPL